jgi:shikimate kinase
MNIIIVGYRCTGKSTVGKSLAGELGWDFVDTDDLITLREGSDIDGIVSAKGWDYFRYLEKMVTHDISGKNNMVIATGGGVVVDKENVNNLKKNGFVIWLRADADIIRSRMENDRKTSSTRPSLTGKDPLDEIKEVLEIRNPFYRKARDVEVDTGTMSVGEITNYIMGEYLARLSRKI